MKRFAALFLAAFIILPVSLSAQVLTNKERRNINLKIIDLIETYERTSDLSDSDEVYDFTDLFVSQDVSVYCDLMGTSRYKSSLSVKEYISEAVKYAGDRMDIDIINIVKGEMSFSDGCWIIPVSFNKYVSYSDANEVLFSSVEYYDRSPYRITLNLRYDPEDDACLIQSIEGKINAEKSFPTGRFQVVKENEYLSGRNQSYAQKMEYNGRPLEYNSFRQAIVPVDFVPKTSDPDVAPVKDLIATAENYDFVMYSFKTNYHRAKLRMGVAPIMAYSIGKGSSPDVKMARSMAFEIGVDFGTTFLVGNSKLGVYTGAAISLSNATVALKKGGNLPEQSILVREDDGLFYPKIVSYSLETATESLTFKDIMIPLYVEGEHRIGTSAAFIWNLGAKAYFGLDTDKGRYKVTGTRTIGSGDPVTIDEEYSLFLNPVSADRSIFNVSAIANVGMDFNLINKADSKLYNRLSATVKLGYEHGLMQVWNSNGPDYSLRDPLLVYYPSADGGGRNIASRSLLSNINLGRQAVWLELGIKFKM